MHYHLIQPYANFLNEFCGSKMQDTYRLTDDAYVQSQIRGFRSFLLEHQYSSVEQMVALGVSEEGARWFLYCTKWIDYQSLNGDIPVVSTMTGQKYCIGERHECAFMSRHPTHSLYHVWVKLGLHSSDEPPSIGVWIRMTNIHKSMVSSIQHKRIDELMRLHTTEEERTRCPVNQGRYAYWRNVLRTALSRRRESMTGVIVHSE